MCIFVQFIPVFMPITKRIKTKNILTRHHKVMSVAWRVERRTFVWPPPTGKNGMGKKKFHLYVNSLHHTWLLYWDMKFLYKMNIIRDNISHVDLGALSISLNVTQHTTPFYRNDFGKHAYFPLHCSTHWARSSHEVVTSGVHKAFR